MTTAPDPTPPIRDRTGRPPADRLSSLGVLRERARQRAAGLAVLPFRSPEPAPPPDPIPTSEPIRRPTSLPSLSPEQVAALRAEHAAGVLHIGAIARKHRISVALTMDAIYGRGAYRDSGRDEPGGAA